MSLQIPPIEQDAAQCIEYNDQENTLHDAGGGMPPHIIHTPSDLKPLITAHQGNDHREEGRLPDSDEEMSHRYRFFKARDELGKTDMEQIRGDQHDAEHAQ